MADLGFGKNFTDFRRVMEFLTFVDPMGKSLDPPLVGMFTSDVRPYYTVESELWSFQVIS